MYLWLLVETEIHLFPSSYSETLRLWISVFFLFGSSSALMRARACVWNIYIVLKWAFSRWIDRFEKLFYQWNWIDLTLKRIKCWKKTIEKLFAPVAGTICRTGTHRQVRYSLPRGTRPADPTNCALATLPRPSDFLVAAAWRMSLRTMFYPVMETTWTRRGRPPSWPAMFDY